MERKRKLELREQNALAWAGAKDIFTVNGSLDSSLKKNTAFIKRLRTAVTAPTLHTFLQEIRTLSLHKYLSEIISACYEGICKLKTPGETSAGVEIVSALHQRFGPAEFTGHLGWLVGRGLSTPEKAHLRSLTAEAREKEEKERISRQRILLKVVTELWLVGVLKSLDDVVKPEDGARSKESAPTAAKSQESGTKTRNATNGGARSSLQSAEPFPLEVLKDLLRHDRDHTNLSLVVLFVKTFNSDILGYQGQSEKAEKDKEAQAAEEIAKDSSADEEYGSGAEEEAPKEPLLPVTPIVTEELQTRFRNIIRVYFDDVKAHILRDHKAIAIQASRNAEAYVRSGEVFEDRQGSHEKQVKAQEKLISNAQTLSDTLGVEMPDLKTDDEDTTAGNGGIGMVKAGDYLRGQGEGAGIWEDEEERRFYENIIDLKDRVPAVLLEDPKKKKAEGDESGEAKGAETKDSSKAISKETSDETKSTEADDQSTVIVNKTVGAQVDTLLARLPEISNKDALDQIAVDFCFLNSKASRNRLLKAVSDIPKGRSDLLPSYSRLVATLGKYLPDVTQGLIAHLDNEFRSLQRRKEKDFLGQVRTANIRYLAELTKFGAVPEHVIFHCLKVSLDDFSRMNIEIICNLLENCGRYLLRNPETSPRMQSFLDTLQRKKAAQHTGQQERMLIENAVYYVDPPQRSAIQQKERSPVEQFIRKLIYLDMNKRNQLKIIKQIRKLHWEEEEVVLVLEKIFSKPGKVKFSNVHLLAEVVSSLYKYRQEWVISVVDNVLESITVGLEQNDFKYNQRRIAEVKYLGELYTYRMVDSPVIFDTMYRIVTFGHEGGTPRPGRICPLDMLDDFFRMRLICTILDTCGDCFERGNARKKLDFFLVFFQYYIYTKDTLPMDVEFIVQDTMSLVRPEWKLAPNLEEAAQAFSEAVTQNYAASNDKTVDPDSGEESLSDNELDESEDRKGRKSDPQSSGDEAEVEPEQAAQSSSESESEAEEEIVVTRKESERDPEADADFDRELAKMMAESLDARKFERKPMFDAALPMKKHIAPRDLSPPREDESGEKAPTLPGTMSFSLLTKRNNRQQTRTVELPSSSNFAVAMKSQQEAERAEQQRIKSLVLNYDLREIDNDGEDAFISPLFPNPNTKSPEDNEKQNSSPSSHSHRGGYARRGQQARKLQLSDVDWYDERKSQTDSSRRLKASKKRS